MGHSKQITGPFDFAEIYDHMLERASDGAVFVEVGASLDHSSLYLALRIQRSGKKVRLYVVNRWSGRSNEDDPFRHYIRTVRRAGVEDVIHPLNMASEQAAELFENGTLDFVFLDADAGHEAVRRDLEAWFPKVKRRGVVAGHNYLHPDFPGVRRAADEFFREQELPLQLHGTSFLVIKPSPRWLKAAQRISRRLTPETSRKPSQCV